MELLGKNFYKQNRAIIIAEFRWITIWIAPLMWITLEVDVYQDDSFILYQILQSNDILKILPTF